MSVYQSDIDDEQSILDSLPNLDRDQLLDILMDDLGFEACDILDRFHDEYYIELDRIGENECFALVQIINEVLS